MNQNEIIETIKSDNYVANIHIDYSPFDPREDDNFGTLIAFHSRCDYSDNNDWTKEELIEHIQEKDILSLPIYLYEHGGIALSTTPFHCQWDSGQIGYIFVSHAEIIEWFGELNLEQAEKNLKAEIEEYSNYINGEVYGYQIYKKEDCEYSNDIESCWGHIGYEWVQEAVKDELDYLEESDNKNEGGA